MAALPTLSRRARTAGPTAPHWPASPGAPSPSPSGWRTCARREADDGARREIGRQVRQVIRMLSRACRSLDHDLRPRRFGRRAVRRGEAALRVAEREWQDEANGLELPEDY